MLSQEKLLIIPDNSINLISIIILLLLLMCIQVAVYLFTVNSQKKELYDLILLKEKILRKRESFQYKRRRNLNLASKRLGNIIQNYIKE